jgi:hypothetical protein
MLSQKKVVHGCIIILIILLLFGTTRAPFLNIGEFPQAEYNLCHPPSLGSCMVDSSSKVGAIIEAINETLVGTYLEEVVSFGPRLTGTSSCEATGKYIFQEFSQMGLETRYHNWSFWDPGISPEVLSGSNIIGTHLGFNRSSDQIIIFNAHYDTVKVSPGADDDASGVAAVLAAARVLSQFQFEHTLRFIAFSGEEQGLLGSKSYARRAYESNDNILVALNADMIGHTETSEGGKTLRVYGTTDVSWILDIVETINDDYGFNYVFNKRTIQPGGGGGSDYYSFLQYGFDAIAFFEYEWNTHMHTARDTLDKVNLSYLTKNTGLITGLLASLTDASNQYPSGKIMVPQRGRIYNDGVIIKTLLTEKIIIFDSLNILADSSPGMYPINRVEFYYDDKLQATDYTHPFQWHMDKISIGYHTLEVVTYDEREGVSRDWVSIFFVNFFRSR